MASKSPTSLKLKAILRFWMRNQSVKESYQIGRGYSPLKAQNINYLQLTQKNLSSSFRLRLLKRCRRTFRVRPMRMTHITKIREWCLSTWVRKRFKSILMEYHLFQKIKLHRISKAIFARGNFRNCQVRQETLRLVPGSLTRIWIRRPNSITHLC